jgi:hypothetical protein
MVRRKVGLRLKIKKHIATKHTEFLILTLAVIFSVGCGKKKTAIDDNKQVTKEAIDARKDEVDVEAKAATKQTDANATIDKARIEKL